MRIILVFSLLTAFFLFASCGTKNEGNSYTTFSISDSFLLESIFPPQLQHCHGSSIVELPNRDLLVAWFQGSGERTADDVAIMGSRFSSKTGKWSTPFILADVPGFPDINPVLFIDNRSSLWLVWYTVMAYQWESSILKYRISDNYINDPGAPVWKWQDMIHIKADGSSPDGIGKNDPFVQTLNRKLDDYYNYLLSAGYINKQNDGPVKEEQWEAARLRDLNIARGMSLISTGTDIGENGEKLKTRLGYPLMRRIGWQTRNKPLFIDKKMLLPLYSDGFDFSLIAITDDYGQTWHFSEPLVGGGNVQPSLALCKDSSIIALMRDNGPPPQRLMKSRSDDGGITWSTVTDTDIPNPGSAADVVVLKSGNWVLVHNDTEDGRHRLSVWLSTDEGRSWPYKKAIVDGVPGSDTRAHYPAIIQGSDGAIHISYTNQIPGTNGGPAQKNIVHAKLTEEWLISR